MSSEPDWYETREVAEAMIKYGGSFVHHLGQALLHADLENSKKIKKTFSNYWNEYLNLGQDRRKREIEHNHNSLVEHSKQVVEERKNDFVNIDELLE